MSGAIVTDSLTKQINEEYLLAQKGVEDAVTHAWNCGALLKAKKAEVGHGNWLPWLAANFSGSARSANDYMLLHTKYPELPNPQSGADLSINRLLAGPGHGYTSESNKWYTPEHVIRSVWEVMGGIDLDPASCPEANETVGAKTYYTEKDDGLQQPWFGRVFCNPPYGGLAGDFAGRMYEFYGSGVTEGILLLNAAAATNAWFQPCFEGVLCFTNGRLQFAKEGVKGESPVNGTVFVYFGPNERKFAEVFESFGNVVKRWPDEV